MFAWCKLVVEMLLYILLFSTYRSLTAFKRAASTRCAPSDDMHEAMQTSEAFAQHLRAASSIVA